MDVKELLDNAAYLPEEMAMFVKHSSDPDNPAFHIFDPDLGYIQTDYVFTDGMDGTKSAYTYVKPDHYRIMIHYADQPCRINTYGDSFTQCAQVNDGETWQEFLAAHIREPIRNFGVGGYGVYQAYLRAMRHEATDVAAENIILNIWDDDHFRNLDVSRWIRTTWMNRDAVRRGGEEDAYPIHGFPWRHVRYDLQSGTFVELPGLCKDLDELQKLADKDTYYETFKDDQIVHLYTLRMGGEASPEKVEELETLGEALGLKLDLRDPATRADDATALHQTYAMRSTQFIVDKLSKWCSQNGRKLLVLLSYDVPSVREFVERGTRFDQEMVDFLQDGGYPFVDCLAKAGDDFKDFGCSTDQFISRYYIGRAGAQVFGHYNPQGNFWFAHTIRDAVVDWLDPKPPTYA